MIFKTQMLFSTFIILVIQSFILFSQGLFYLSRPADKSRLRFLILTITYILYNFFSGIYPDERFSLSIFLQNLVAYFVGILVAVYFIYYIYKEFDIYPFKLLNIKFFTLLLMFSFVTFFIMPYYFTNDLGISRRLFIIIPLVFALAYVVQIGFQFWRSYKTLLKKNELERCHTLRMISGYLGLLSLASMPILVSIGDYQAIEQPIVNFGYFTIATVYISDLIRESRIESKMLKSISYNDNKSSKSPRFEVPHDVTIKILSKLELFELNLEFTKSNISISGLSKKIGTNPKYLSVVINDTKKKSFTNYINDLRIEFAVERLQKDPKFRNYTIKHIAQESGFGSSESFSRAFYKNQGIYPSEHIKSL